MAGRVPLIAGLHEEPRELRKGMIYLVEAMRVEPDPACIEAQRECEPPMQGEGELVCRG